jgi:23S rRNA pseudouridine1911/1915/1917 synthase
MPTLRETHKVSENQTATRLSDFVFENFCLLTTANAARKAIKRGQITVDGEVKTTGFWVQPHQKIELWSETEAESLKKVFCFKLTVVYEDPYLALVIKPAGIEVRSHKLKCIENALPFNLKISSLEDALRRPRAVHRLDYSTSGLLLVAKTESALKSLSRLFEERKIQKVYHAVVQGKCSDRGEIVEAINGQEAITCFEKIKAVPSLRNGELTLLKLMPLSGRRHQLRIHMAMQGHPIVGDTFYGMKGQILRGKSLFLCATSLSFQHPFENKYVDVNVECPKKFAALMEREKKRFFT